MCVSGVRQDNAKKFIELGNHGGKGSDAHKGTFTPPSAAVVCRGRGFAVRRGTVCLLLRRSAVLLPLLQWWAVRVVVNVQRL